MAKEYISIDLPGKMLYKDEFDIKIRKITPIEQKFIISLSQKEQKTNQDYINFIKSLVSFNNPIMTFEKLFWFDVQYVLYRIRFSTYEKYPIKLTFSCLDPDCEEEIKYELKLGELDIYTPDDLKDIKFEIELDNLGISPIRNKIVNDDLEIDRLIKNKKLDPNDIQMRLLLLDLCLISNGKTLQEMYNLAEEGVITAEDIIRIETWFTECVWGVKEKVNIKCPKCGREESREYALALEDFFSAF